LRDPFEDFSLRSGRTVFHMPRCFALKLLLRFKFGVSNMCITGAFFTRCTSRRTAERKCKDWKMEQMQGNA